MKLKELVGVLGSTTKVRVWNVKEPDADDLFMRADEMWNSSHPWLEYQIVQAQINHPKPIELSIVVNPETD